MVTNTCIEGNKYRDINVEIKGMCEKTVSL